MIVLSPSTMLNFRYGVTNAEYLERRVTQGTDLAKLGFSPALTGASDVGIASFTLTLARSGRTPAAALQG